MRLRVAGTILAALVNLMAVDVAPAHADTFGGWKYTLCGTCTATFPSDCGFAGTNIQSDATPYKHNAAAGNDCLTNETVSIEIDHDSSSGVIDSRYLSGTNFAQRQLQQATSAGEWWTWYAEISGYLYGCAGSSSDFNYCWHSSD